MCAISNCFRANKANSKYAVNQMSMTKSIFLIVLVYSFWVIEKKYRQNRKFEFFFFGRKCEIFLGPNFDFVDFFYETKKSLSPTFLNCELECKLVVCIRYLIGLFFCIVVFVSIASIIYRTTKRWSNGYQCGINSNHAHSHRFQIHDNKCIVPNEKIAR